MPFMPFSVRIGLGLLVAMLALALACGDGESPTPSPIVATASPTAGATPSPSPIVATAAPTVTATPTATAQPSPQPTVPQELRVNLGGEPGSLDPQLVTSLPEWSVVRQVFQGLFGFTPDLALEPVVATEIPTVGNGGISPDGLTYIFKLRDDVTWSDGAPVTASDFAYTLKRVLDPQVAAPLSFLYSAIKGAQEYATAVGVEGAALEALRDGLGIEATDDLTLRVTLGRPDPTFLQKLTLRAALPVRQDVVEEFGSGWTEAGNYMGNGPFIMTEWAHQDQITLEANPNYWGPSPKLSKITYRMIADPNSELLAYRNGELELSQVPPGTERAILSDPDLEGEVIRASQLFSLGLFFNTSEPPFDNVLVRQAFATALDREAWIEKVKSGVGHAATSWLPPGIPGHDPDLGQEYSFDLERGRQLLAEAGFPGGEGFPSTSYVFVGLGDGQLMAEFIQGQFKENLGIDLILEPLDPPSYGQQVMGARQFQLTPFGGSGDYPDPEDSLAALFMTGAPFNIAQYSNPAFDQLARQASTELDQTKRIALWMDAHRIVIEDAPLAPFFFGERLFLKKPGVQGLTLTPIDGAIPGDTRLGEVFLEP